MGNPIFRKRTKLVEVDDDDKEIVVKELIRKMKKAEQG